MPHLPLLAAIISSGTQMWYPQGLLDLALWVFCALDPPVFTYGYLLSPTDHSSEYTPKDRLQLYWHSYHLRTDLSSMPPMITSWVEARGVSLVFLIDFSGTQPASHYNDFIEPTTQCTQNPSLCPQPDALSTLSSSFPQKPGHISCRKTVLRILGQHAAPPALLTQQAAPWNLACHVHCPDGYPKPNLINVLSLH